jgi:hypothetical protein
MMKKLMFVCLIALLISAGMSLAQNVTTWSATVKNIEALLQQYIQKSDELLRKEDSLYASINQNPLSYAGTACANCYWPAHQCAILGRMLGRAELIAHLEAPLPSLSSSLREVWSTAQSLDQWVFTANRLLKSSDQERGNIWNLECIGKFDIPVSGFEERGQGTVNMKTDGTYLWVYGDIVVGFYEELVEVLDEHPEIKIVGLGSAGGSVRDAVLAGSEIRRRGLGTQLSGPCLSACPLVFIGGTSRFVMRPFPALGFHQIYQAEGTVPLDAPIYQSVHDYVWSMGGDGNWIVSQMAMASPDEMNIQGDDEQERDQLCLRGIVTGYQGFGSNIC